MKKMYFKKFMSVFMAVLMLLSCWVWIAPEKASAATGSVPPLTWVSVNSSGAASRGDSSKIVICSDGGEGNTAVGLMKFDISTFPSDVASATLTVNSGNHGGTLANSTVSIFSVDPSKYPVGNGVYTTSNTFSSVFNGAYTGTNAANNAYSYYGVSSSASLGTINQSSTGSHTFDVTDAVNAAKGSSRTELCLLFVMPTCYDDSNGNTWSDLYIYSADTSLSYEKADTVTTYPVNLQLNGGVSAAFTNSALDSSSSVYSIDTSDSKTYYLNLVNRSTQAATIVTMNNTSYLSGYSANTVIPAGGIKSFQINKSSMSTSDNQIYNFSFKYTLDNVYQSGGTSLEEFYQAAYIGTWHSSDDSKNIGQEGTETNPGFTLQQDEQDICNEFQTDTGILERAQDTTGNRTIKVTFGYNYWVDTTDLDAKTWERLGFRMRAQKWGERRQHFQPDGYGTMNLTGDMGDSNASLSIADLVTSYSGYSDTFTYPATSRPWAYVNTPCNPQWDGQSETKYGTLWNAGDQGWFRFCGNLFTGSTTTSNPAKIVFTDMQWRKPSITLSPTQRNVTFTGTINCYIYDKTELRNYVSTVLAVAPMSARFDSTVWSNYETALQNAVRVLANYKTNQYEVNQALASLQNAYTALSQSSSLVNQVANVTYYKHSGDYSSAVAETTTPKYMLIPIGSHTVAHYDAYKADTNKSSAIVTSYTVDDTDIQTIDYHYWSIDFSAVQSALDAADAILEKDPWCYTAEYRSALQTARDNLALVDQTEYTSAPEFQSEVDSLVAAVNDLVSAEATDSNHTHVKGELQQDSAPTCEDTGLGHYDCKYCGVRIESDVEIPANGHTLSATTENVSTCFAQGNIAYWTCSVCSKVFTDAEAATEIADNNGDGKKDADDAVVDTLEHDFSESDDRLHNLGNGTHNWSCAHNCGSYGTAEDIDKYVSCTYTYTDKNDNVHTAACSCGYTTDVEHAWDEGVIYPLPTCTDTGVKTFTCSQCNGTKTEAVSATGHTEEKMDAVAPTCEGTGLTEGTKCSVCGAIITPQEVVSATGHSMSDWIVDNAATCIAAGSQHKECANCDYTETETIPATGVHNYGNWTKEDATIHIGTCINSGCTATTSEAHAITDTAIHVQGNWHHYKCEKCDAYGSLINGVYTDNAKEECYGDGATYTEIDGDTVNHTATCKCGNTTTVSHNWVEDTTKRADVSCTADGKAYYNCPDCGAEKTEILTALGHSFTTDIKSNNDNTHDYKCSRCDVRGAVVDGVHTPNDTENCTGGTAVCTAKAVCEKCSAEYGTELGHDMKKIEAQAADCTVDGNIEYYICQREICGKLYLDENGNTETTADDVKIEASHKWNDSYTVDAEATCTQAGSESIHCSACDATKDSREITALGHNDGVWVVTKKASCTDGGSKELRCTRVNGDLTCGMVLETETIAVRSHSWSEWTVITAPTYTTDGEESRYCQNTETEEHEACSAVETRTVAELDDTTSAEGTISFDGGAWSEFLNTITFGIFVNYDVELEITAEDAETGIASVEYFVSDKAMTLDEIKAHTDWTEYDETAKLTIAKSDTEAYIVYAKIVNGDGDVTYLSTDGIVVDTTAPVLTITADHGDAQTNVYCSEVTITVEEANLASATFDGKAVAIGTGGFWCNTVGTHTFEVVDMAGNKTSVIFQINNGHTESEAVEENTVEATCETAGSYNSVVYCSVCEEELSRTQVTVEALGHAWNEGVVTTAPTCTENGVKTFTCKNDANHTYTEPVEAVGHSYNAVVTTAPTCTENGVKTFTCKNDANHTYTEPVNAVGHSYSAVVTNPTCISQGYTTHTCSNCKDSYVDSYVDAIRHNYSAVVTAPTCISQGYTTHTCSNCGDSYVDSYVEVSGHDWLEGVVTTAPTCETAGVMTYICKNDASHTKTEDIEPTGHNGDNGKVIKESTCTVGGEKVFTCTNAGCGETYTETLNPLGHSYGRVVTPSGCTEQGYTTYTCVNCGDTYVTSYTDAVGHSVGAWVTTKEVSCTEDGERCRYCSECDYYETEVIPASEHSWGEWKLVSGEICAEGAVRQRECVICGASESDILADGEHFYRTDENGNIVFDNILKPGCEHEGFYIYRCTLCGAEVKFTAATPGYEQELAATGHNWQKDENGNIVYVQVKSVTCFTDGEHYRTCTNENCHLDYNREYLTITTVGHQLKAVSGKDATCDDNGYSNYYQCIVCDYEHNKVIYPAMGHIDEDSDGVCESCKSSVDSDSSNSVSSKDCGCMCHADGFMGIIYKIVRFFWKLFGINETCECGEAHY